MRCPECNKFATYAEPDEPEANLEVDDEGRVSGDVRVVLTSECCGAELKEALFDVADKLEVMEAFKKHKADAKAKDDEANTPEDERDDHELELEEEVESSTRTEGKGRRAKEFRGYHATLTIKCSCGETIEDGAEISDDASVAHMDELV